MNLLLSNDDGVLAPGIQSLYQSLTDDHNVTVVAPLSERSTHRSYD
jgi:5'-nucleotidase